MGLFGKKKEKEKKVCPICGSEIKFFSSRVLADGETICESCENKVRNNYGLYYKQRFFAVDRDGDGFIDNDKLDDAIRHATLAEVKEIIAMNEAADEAATERYGDYANMFTVEDSFTIAPKATEVGIKRAKLFKNKTVVQGRAAKGGFNTDDAVRLLSGGGETATQVLHAYKNTGQDLDTEMRANLQKKGVQNGEAGWLVLDIEGGVAPGSIVVK